MWTTMLLLAHGAEPDWKLLHAPEATASSFLQNNWNKFTENYHPSYILDDNPRTAWVEGVDGNGEGEWLEVPLSRVSAAKAVRLRIRNGYQKSENLHKANAAPTKVRVELLASVGAVHTEELALDGAAMDWQTLVLTPAEPVAMRGLRLTVLETRDGTAYKDTCISDVEVAVQVDDGTYSKLYENAKKQQLLAWIGSREEAAAFFANTPKQWPFASTHFDAAKRQDLTPAEAAELGAAFQKQHDGWEADYRSEGAWQRVDGSVPRLPDGVRFEWFKAGTEKGEAFGAVLPRWLAPELTFSEATGEWRYQEPPPDLEAAGPGWFDRSQKWNDLSNVKVLERHDDGSPAKAAFRHRRSVYFRIVEDEDWRGYVTLDASGRTEQISWSRQHRAEEGCGEGLFGRRWTFDRKEDGRIERIDDELSYECPPYEGEGDRTWRSSRTTYTAK